jgi:hypothetical protein
MMPYQARPLSLTVICCPDCGLPAEVTDRFSLGSTSGPVDHVALRCVAGHLFRMPVDLLAGEEQGQLTTSRSSAASRLA